MLFIFGIIFGLAFPIIAPSAYDTVKKKVVKIIKAAQDK